MVDTTRTEPASFTIRVGFHVPGVLAAYMHKAVEDGVTCDEMKRGLRGLLDELTARCPACGNTWPVELFDEPIPAELYDLASQVKYQDFLPEIEKRYATFNATCSTCGVQGRLATETLGDGKQVAA